MRVPLSGSGSLGSYSSWFTCVWLILGAFHGMLHETPSYLRVFILQGEGSDSLSRIWFMLSVQIQHWLGLVQKFWLLSHAVTLDLGFWIYKYWGFPASGPLVHKIISLALRQLDSGKFKLLPIWAAGPSIWMTRSLCYWLKKKSYMCHLQPDSHRLLLLFFFERFSHRLLERVISCATT